jgi:uncharacterized caspase-like protein
VALKRSIHFGLNRLDPKRYAGFTGDLLAAENDASGLAAIFAAAGYVAASVLTRNATLANARDVFVNAANQSRPGDIFVFSFSGHGSQLPGDEPDGTDETLCFYDGQLRDKDLREWLARFQTGVNVLIIIDACHSGGMDRAAASGPRVRALPDGVAARLVELPDGPRVRAQPRCHLGWMLACAEDQVALDGEHFGAWTGALIESAQKLTESFKQRAVTVLEWYSAAARMIRLPQGREQTPQLRSEGWAINDARIFE